MKRFFAFLCSLTLLFSLVGCNVLSVFLNEKEGFSLSTNLKNCTIKGNQIVIIVPYGTYAMSFVDAFSIPENYKWDLYHDRACTPGTKSTSKRVDLEFATEPFYAFFVNKDDGSETYLYEIFVCQSVVGKYSRTSGSGHVFTLEFFEDGTFREAYSQPGISETIGTWSQDGYRVRYHVDWKNKTYTSLIHHEGIEFLGQFYYRKS